MRYALPDRASRFLLLFAVALTQASCVSLQHPLVDPEKAVLDVRLFGQWKYGNKGESAHLFIGKPAPVDTENCPVGLMLVHAVGFSAEHELRPEPTPLHVFVAKLGNDDYLHLINRREKGMLEKWDKNQITSYHLCKYTVTKDRLTLWMMDTDAVRKAVKDGKLTDEVKKQGFVESIHLAEPPESMAKILQQGGNKALFSGKAMILDRVKW